MNYGDIDDLHYQYLLIFHEHAQRKFQVKIACPIPGCNRELLLTFFHKRGDFSEYTGTYSVTFYHRLKPGEPAARIEIEWSRADLRSEEYELQRVREEQQERRVQKEQ